ncbi:C-type lectin domain family 2 member D-like [Notechis scutatus]|uniref:C-type lectin domain family 2 member D-like n=1 Tax=Notechis scutatus TaxID=8663 RepID=A0A6J1VI19_9SAUR|nr:C-type lectin domain family 2 member D-like [Notechis scutatus]
MPPDLKILVDDDSGCGDRLTPEVTTGSSDAKKARNTGKNRHLPRRIADNKLIIAAVVLITALIITIIVLAVKTKSHPCSRPFASQGVACPDSWIGYLGKCFYASKEDRNWSLSLETCSSFNASLAVIDSQKELDFWVKIFKPFHYWIGLSREVNQVWKWSNGTEFRNQFPVRGEGFCAYLNGKGADSTLCSMEKLFLCSRPESCRIPGYQPHPKKELLP